jgi:hypothetical protein
VNCPFAAAPRGAARRFALLISTPARRRLFDVERPRGMSAQKRD